MPRSAKCQLLRLFKVYHALSGLVLLPRAWTTFLCACFPLDICAQQVLDSTEAVESIREEDSGVVDSLPASKENTPPSSIATLQESMSTTVDIVECIEVEPFLVFSDGKEDVLRGLKGGPSDALLVYATKTTDDKGRDFVVQETFLTTYRSFIPAQTLVEKLIAR